MKKSIAAFLQRFIVPLRTSLCGYKYIHTKIKQKSSIFKVRNMIPKLEIPYDTTNLVLNRVLPPLLYEHCTNILKAFPCHFIPDTGLEFGLECPVILSSSSMGRGYKHEPPCLVVECLKKKQCSESFLIILFLESSYFL